MKVFIVICWTFTAIPSGGSATDRSCAVHLYSNVVLVVVRSILWFLFLFSEPHYGWKY